MLTLRLQGVCSFKLMSFNRAPSPITRSDGPRNSRGVLGVEAIGEDLEGFWESEEREGGARLLAGPSFHISPAGQRWQLTATGGPMFHPSDTGRASSAFRDLPPDTSRASYAFKVSLSVSLMSAP